METNINNMFGGRIDHPAYDLRVKPASNQFLSGITLYTFETVADGRTGPRVAYESIDGVSGTCGDHPDHPLLPWMEKLLTYSTLKT